MKADPETTAAVTAVMNQMADAYARRDMAALLAVCAPDPDNLMYGTGADEKRLGLDGIRAQAERDWSQTEAGSIAFEWTSVSAAGAVAWFAADALFQLTAGGEEMAFPARVTAVLERRGGRWLIAQSHFSLPAAGQEEGAAFPE